MWPLSSGESTTENSLGGLKAKSKRSINSPASNLQSSTSSASVGLQKLDQSPAACPPGFVNLMESRAQLSRLDPDPQSTEAPAPLAMEPDTNSYLEALPYELLLEITKLLPTDALKNLCLVSKTVITAAQEVLYTAVTLPVPYTYIYPNWGQYQISAFIKTNIQNSAHAGRVRHLHLCVYSREIHSSIMDVLQGPLRVFPIEDFYRSFGISYLEYVKISMHERPLLGIMLLLFPQLKSFHLDLIEGEGRYYNAQFGLLPNNEWVFPRIAAFENLESLCIGHSSVPLLTYNFKRLEKLSIQRAHPVKLQRWLERLPTGILLPRLKSLALELNYRVDYYDYDNDLLDGFRFEDYGDEVLRALEAIRSQLGCSNIISLKVLSLGGDCTPIAAQALEHWPQLENTMLIHDDPDWTARLIRYEFDFGFLENTDAKDGISRGTIMNFRSSSVLGNLPIRTQDIYVEDTQVGPAKWLEVISAARARLQNLRKVVLVMDVYFVTFDEDAASAAQAQLLRTGIDVSIEYRAMDWRINRYL